MKTLLFLVGILIVSVTSTHGAVVNNDGKQVIELDAEKLPNDVGFIYKRAQDFFNSLFSSQVEIQIVKNYQKTINGLITYYGPEKLMSNDVVFVSVLDISIADAPSIVLAEKSYTSLEAFPVEFSINVNENEIKDYGRYSLSVRVERNGQLAFVSNYRTAITGDDGKLLDYALLVGLIKVEQSLCQSSTTSISGYVNLKDFSHESIREGSVVKVTVADTSRMDAPSITLGEEIYVMLGENQFPIKFNVTYNCKPYNNFKQGDYSIRVSITNNDQLTHVSDERFSIKNENDELLPCKNLTVIKIPPPPNVINQPLMVRINGLLQCKIDCSRNFLNAGNQQAEITIRDVSLADKESSELAKRVIDLNTEWSFPLPYEIEFDSTKISQIGVYAISARIIRKNDGQLTFITDTRNEIIDFNTGNFRRNIDMSVRRT